MPSCAAKGCKNRDERNQRKKGTTFHRFPHTDPKRLTRWVFNTNRDSWTPSARSQLCSEHFTEDCFNRTGNNVQLKSKAVPTIFAFSAHLQEKPKYLVPPPCKIEIKVETEETESVTISSESSDVHVDTIKSPPDVTVIYKEHLYANMESPRELKRKLNDVTKKLEESRKKTKVEQQKSRRLKQRVSKLTSLVNFLLNSKKMKAEQHKSRNLKLKANSITSLVNSLRDQNMIGTGCAQTLDATFSAVPKDVMKRILC